MARKRPGEGRTALVTGASYGIGVDLAECFARDGYNLILTARSADLLSTTAQALEKATGVSVATFALDLGVQGAGTELARQVAAKQLQVDVLVNNAGFGIAGGLDASSAEQQLGMIDLNVRALVELTQIYWPVMMKAGCGGVLNVASTAAFQPGPLMAVYYASKAFVLSFSEALWKEGESAGVHVSCLCPGPTASRFRERAGTGKTRLSRAGEPMTSMAVAKLGYRGFVRNTRVVIPGFRNRMMAGLVPYLPRRRLLGIVYSMQSPA